MFIFDKYELSQITRYFHIFMRINYFNFAGCTSYNGLQILQIVSGLINAYRAWVRPPWELRPGPPSPWLVTLVPPRSSRHPCTPLGRLAWGKCRKIAIFQLIVSTGSSHVKWKISLYRFTRRHYLHILAKLESRITLLLLHPSPPPQKKK